MRPWRRVRSRIARLLGRNRRRSATAEATNLLCELRPLLRALEPEARAFLGFCFERLDQSKGQILQDLFVLYETGDKRGGYFVEFGAADGIAGSNTYLLETGYGWTGILAEPARVWHQALGRSRSCRIDRRCVAARTGERALFRECAHPELSSIDSCAENDRFAYMRKAARRYCVETVSLTDLLRQHGAPASFDYLSVDTEGSEPMILEALDFDAFRPHIITVEHCHSPARDRLYALLSGHGYRRKFEQLSQIEDWYVLA